MKGVILAGGNGTRLRPLTDITNKCALPVYDRPMIHYSMEAMAASGVNDVLVITGGSAAGQMIHLLGNGSQFGLRRVYFAVQEKAGGIAHGLQLAEEFAADEPVFLALGDNLFFGNGMAASVSQFSQDPRGARIFLSAVPDPQRFGVAVVRGERVVSLEEKPGNPKSNLAVTGFYLYDSSVFDRIRTLEPSARGELEVTDLNRTYMVEGRLNYSMLDGDWVDAGTFESLHAASAMARRFATRSVSARKAA